MAMGNGYRTAFAATRLKSVVRVGWSSFKEGAVNPILFYARGIVVKDFVSYNCQR